MAGYEPVEVFRRELVLVEELPALFFAAVPLPFFADAFVADDARFAVDVEPDDLDFVPDAFVPAFFVPDERLRLERDDDAFLSPIGSTLPTALIAPPATSPTVSATLPAAVPTFLTTFGPIGRASMHPAGRGKGPLNRHVSRPECNGRASGNQATDSVVEVRAIVGRMPDEIVLFDGRMDTQRVRVWLERTPDGGIALLSHDIGPKLERFFGDDEIETTLEIDADQLPALADALGDPDADPMTMLADRYGGDAMATTHLRELLAAHDIPHRFSVI